MRKILMWVILLVGGISMTSVAEDFRRTQIVEVGGTFYVSFMGVFEEDENISCYCQNPGGSLEFISELGVVRAFGLVGVTPEEAGDYYFFSLDYLRNPSGYNSLCVTLIVVPAGTMIARQENKRELSNRHESLYADAVIEKKKCFTI